jgi:RND family efflux transporter MFP subunit
MRKKILIGSGVCILLIVGYFIFFLQKPVEKKKIETSKVKRGTLKIAFSLDGKTTIERRDLKFTVNGKVSHIAVKEGQEVKKWQYLMALDTQDVQKNLERDLKDYLITRNTFDQTGQVTYSAGALNDTMKRALESSQYTLDKSVLDVEIQNIALKESYLYSPIDGIVSAINIKDGETTNTQNSNSVITVTKPGSLFVEVYAEDTDILKIKKEQKTVAKIDAVPGVIFPATIDFVSNLAVVDQNDLSTYKIRVIINDSKGYDLVDGMASQVQFITKEKSNVLIIPNTAVYRKNNISYVSVLREGKSQEIKVDTGFTDGKEVEIISGLSLGDDVILP